jgi:uncharacterized protein (TIGR03032 family)
MKVAFSRGFVVWLESHNISLAASSYQSGQLFLIGRDGDRLSIHMEGFGHAMGLSISSRSISLATNRQIHRLVNVGPRGDFDCCYALRSTATVGNVDIHELRGDVFVNTAYSCLARPHDVHSFEVAWKPPFISALAPEDRCHLNGLAMRDGKPAFVTAVCRSDIVAGWRDRRLNSGVVIDVATGEPVLDGLSMPHSPRWSEELWVLNSGKGQLLRGGDVVAFLPGFLRGLAFVGKYAIVGLSLPRAESFAGLALDQALKDRDAEPWCGIQIVDTETGHIVEWLRFTDGVRELFDVQVIPGAVRPMSLANAPVTIR